MNGDTAKKSLQSNSYNWKGVMDFIKEEVKTSTNEWAHEKQMLIKKINELEKEVKTLKKSNQELLSKLNSNNLNTPCNNNFGSGSTTGITFSGITLNSPLNLDRNHKRGESDKINFKNDAEDKLQRFREKIAKSKQNSDEIIKRKTKSYGGFERLIENKLMENSLNMNRHPLNNYNSSHFANTNGINGGNFNNSNNINNNSTNLPFRVSLQSTLNDENNHSSRPGTNLNSNRQNNKMMEFSKALAANNSKLSEKEEESSTNTQETIVKKTTILDNSNYSNNQIITTISNDDSYVTRNSMIFQPGNSSANTSINVNLNASSEMDLRRSVNNERNSMKNPLISSVNSISSKTSHNPFLVLKSHFDSVREIYLTPDKRHLVSVGEDMVINFWDFRKALKQVKENLEPYLTLRSHTTPIFTLTGPRETTVSNNSNELNVYSSGMDGVIRCTKVPRGNFDKYQSVDETISDLCLQPWRAHQDMIWDLNYHPTENIMSSVSSDGTVKIFRGHEASNSDKSYYSFDSRSKNLIRQFTFKNNYYNFIEIPTSSNWSNKSFNHIYVSHIAPYVKLYDIETGKSVCDYSYTVEKNIPFECQQSNKIIFHDLANVLITGHEDRQIRFFDPNQNKIIKSIVAHTDSVSALNIGLNDFEFLSASHDGSLRCWDMRIFKLLFDIPAHRKKYDEGCLSIKCFPTEKFVLTCGADGLIKAFQFGN